MTCTACESARTNRFCGMYRADCLECSARALSHSPAYHAAATANVLTAAYWDALQAVFGEGWKQGHAQVKRWAEMREGAKP